VGSADRIHVGIGAAALTVALAGCTRQPGPEQVRADAERRMPGCRTLGYGAGEGDGDTVYLIVQMRCATAPQERWLELGYRFAGTQWQLFSKSTIDQADMKGRSKPYR